MRAAHRAIRILAELEFAELHAERIKQQQAPHEIVTTAEDQLDRLHRLDGTNDSGQDAEHTALRARRHKARWRRLRIQAAIARSIGHAENGNLPFKTENGAVHVRLPE